MFLRPSVIDIDRPDHPALRGPGCSEAMRKAFTVGVFLGGGLAAVYSGSRAIKYGLERRLVIDAVLRNIVYIGFPTGITFGAGAWLRC